MNKEQSVPRRTIEGGRVAYATREGEVSRTDRRTARTRRSLFAALEGLSSSLPLDELSVARVAEAADINRVTFYAHYRNLDELLDAAFDAVVGEASASMAEMFVDAEGLDEVAKNVRAYAEALLRHQGFLSWVYDSSSKDRLVARLGEALRSMFSRRIEAAGPACSARRSELFTRYAAGGLASLILGLIAEGPTAADIDELASFLPAVWLPSTYAVLGIGSRDESARGSD